MGRRSRSFAEHASEAADVAKELAGKLDAVAQNKHDTQICEVQHLLGRGEASGEDLAKAADIVHKLCLMLRGGVELAVHGCACLYKAAQGCTRLCLSVQSGIRLYLFVPVFTRLYLSVQGCTCPYKGTQGWTRLYLSGQVQPCTDRYSLVKTGINRYSLIPPCTDRHSLVHPCTDKLCLVQLCTDRHSLV